jgi:hypothetical protein
LSLTRVEMPIQLLTTESVPLPSSVVPFPIPPTKLK